MPFFPGRGGCLPPALRYHEVWHTERRPRAGARRDRGLIGVW